MLLGVRLPLNCIICSKKDKRGERLTRTAALHGENFRFKSCYSQFQEDQVADVINIFESCSQWQQKESSDAKMYRALTYVKHRYRQVAWNSQLCYSFCPTGCFILFLPLVSFLSLPLACLYLSLSSPSATDPVRTSGLVSTLLSHGCVWPACESWEGSPFTLGTFQTGAE